METTLSRKRSLCFTTEHVSGPEKPNNFSSRETIAKMKQALTIQLTDRIRREEHSRIQAQMQEKYKEKMTCIICQCTLDLPVKICINGHYACAICFKVWSDREKFEITYDSKFLPVVKTSRDSDTYLRCPLKCGVTSLASLRTPADCLVYDLIDDGKTRVCSFTGCAEKLSGRSMCAHFFVCPRQTVQCAACAKSIPVVSYKHHIQHECTELSCCLCHSSDLDNVPPSTYSYHQLQTHLKFHKNATDFREKVFTLLDELASVLGNRYKTGEMHVPDNNSSYIDGNDFADTIHLAAMLKQFIDGQRGTSERLSHSIELSSSIIKKLL